MEATNHQSSGHILLGCLSMGKGGYGKGWGNGPYQNQNQWNGGWNNWQYNGHNGFGRKPNNNNGGLGMSTMAGNLTNFMGELCAFGEMSRLGSVLSSAYNSQQPTDVANAGLSAGQKSVTAPDPNKDALLHKLETVVDTMHSKIAPEQVSPKKMTSASGETFDAESFEMMLGNSKRFSQMQTDVGQVKGEIQSINDNMAGIKNVQQHGFSKIESMLAFMSTGNSSAPPCGAAPTVTNDTTANAKDEPLQITPAVHDELVEFLSLNTGSPMVVRARPTTGRPKSFPRWLGIVLNSKRPHNWIEVLRQLGHDDNVLAALDDMDSIFDFIISKVDPKGMAKST